MTYDEATKVLGVLKAAYPHSYKDLTKKDAESMISLWAVMFADDPYATVNAAVGALIATRTAGYTPTIGEIKEQIQRLTAPTELSEQEAWAMVAKACQNGLYGYKKEFAKLPPEVQRALGAPEQLRDWAAVDLDEFNTVIASNFMRSYRTHLKREKENAILPQSIRNLIGGMAMEMIGGAE